MKAYMYLYEPGQDYIKMSLVLTTKCTVLATFSSCLPGQTLRGKTRNLRQYDHQLWNISVCSGDLPTPQDSVPQESGGFQVGVQKIDHCHERPLVLKDLIFLAEGMVFQHVQDRVHCLWNSNKIHNLL